MCGAGQRFWGGWVVGRAPPAPSPPPPSLSPGGCRDSCREQHPDSTPPLPTLFLRLLRGMKNNPRAHPSFPRLYLLVCNAAPHQPPSSSPPNSPIPAVGSVLGWLQCDHITVLGWAPLCMRSASPSCGARSTVVPSPLDFLPPHLECHSLHLLFYALYFQ